MTKKLWRREAKKELSGRRTGRQIKYARQMEEAMFKNAVKIYPLLDALFKRSNVI